jgi:hypothetical protein
MTTIPFTGSFTADPDHSSFQAQLRHMGVGSFRTGFTDIEARLETGPDGARLTGRARVGSIAITRPPEFRAHVVEGEDFFDGRDLAFESRRLEFSDDGTVIYPDLALIPARLEDSHAVASEGPTSTASPDTWADVLGVATQRAASASEPYFETASRRSRSW